MLIITGVRSAQIFGKDQEEDESEGVGVTKKKKAMESELGIEFVE